MIFKRELGKKLAIERIERRLVAGYVAKKLNMSILRLEHVELGHKKSGWHNYEKLLQFYHKKVRIELVDDEGE